MTSECTVFVLKLFCAAASIACVIAVRMCKVLVICAVRAACLNHTVRDDADMTYEPGIDESKIDCLTLRLSLCSFQGTRTHDAGLKLCCVCDMLEKGEVNRRGELWIIEAFHLANLPTIPLTSSRLQNGRVSNLVTASQALCYPSPSCCSLPLLHLLSQRRPQNTKYYHRTISSRLSRRAIGECFEVWPLYMD